MLVLFVCMCMLVICGCAYCCDWCNVGIYVVYMCLAETMCDVYVLTICYGGMLITCVFVC